MGEKMRTPIPALAGAPRNRDWFSSAVRIGCALLAAALLAAAIGLWARHGSAVFFDLIASGIAYCF